MHWAHCLLPLIYFLLHVYQKDVDQQALELYHRNKKSAIEFLNEYSNEEGEKVMKEAIKLGDFLWTKYDEKF